MPETITQTAPTAQVTWLLARLMAGLPISIADNGLSPRWKEVFADLVDLPVGARLGALERKLAAMPDIDADGLLRDIFAMDPTRESAEEAENVDIHPAALPAAAPFPVAALPSAFRAYVTEGAASLGCPPDYIAVPLLACAGAAIGTTTRLQIKSGWYECPLLYAAIIAPSGSKKTPALDLAVQFTQDKGTAHNLDHQQALENYERILAEYQVFKEAMRRNRDKSQIPDLPDKPTRPVLKRTWIADATVEAQAQRLQQNPRGLALIRDELASLLLSLNQYRSGRGADLQFFLSTWSCNPTAVDRKQDVDPLILNRPFLAIVGGIQPAVLVRVFGGDRLYDGFTPRFLVSDPELMPQRSSEATIGEDSLQRAQACFEALYRICPADPYAIIPEPQLVRLTPEARARFVEWENRLGEELDLLSADDPFRAALSKLIAYVARLALIIHVCDWASGAHGHFGELNEETMKSAVRIAEYFLAHARRVWRRLVESADDSRIRQIANWIHRKNRPVTARDILRGRVAGLKSTKETEEILKQMVECGLLDSLQESRRVLYTLRRGESR
jgi:hypothetical protein